MSAGADEAPRITPMVMTAEEKQARRHQRRADKVNAKAREIIGPLFAEQAPQTNAEAEFWRWRRNIADGVERCENTVGVAAHGLKWLKLRAIERMAVDLLGALNRVSAAALYEECPQPEN